MFGFDVHIFIWPDDLYGISLVPKIASESKLVRSLAWNEPHHGCQMKLGLLSITASTAL